MQGFAGSLYWSPLNREVICSGITKQWTQILQDVSIPVNIHVGEELVYNDQAWTEFYFV